ncbi:TPA: hypothetical protein ACGWER_001735 [Streptococcus agalactiae]|nr:hypothetical protein [Streptococcus agalactiae]HEO2267383.1 hypothetical protein [Streptococcus agalactiae]HEO7770443.1 hypothetical protein [Streptococcus agalactiae]
MTEINAFEQLKGRKQKRREPMVFESVEIEQTTTPIENKVKTDETDKNITIKSNGAVKQLLEERYSESSKKESVQKSIRLYKDQVDILEKLAKQKGSGSLSDILRDVLDIAFDIKR